MMAETQSLKIRRASSRYKQAEASPDRGECGQAQELLASVP